MRCVKVGHLFGAEVGQEVVDECPQRSEQRVVVLLGVECIRVAEQRSEDGRHQDHVAAEDEHEIDGLPQHHEQRERDLGDLAHDQEVAEEAQPRYYQHQDHVVIVEPLRLHLQDVLGRRLPNDVECEDVHGTRE